ncbi:unnamed protein product, partial [Timema podura]|nr:unnamed protein product [Timema podura]
MNQTSTTSWRYRIGKVEFRGSEPASVEGEWKTYLGKTTPSSPDRDSNLNLPFLYSLAQHKTSALANNTTETAETVEAIVTQLMEKQRLARAAALTKQLECGCPDSTCADGKTCSHPMRRISAAKTANTTDHTSRQAVVSMTSLSSDNNNQVIC